MRANERLDGTEDVTEPPRLRRISARVDRVRCVLRCERRFLLAQHHSRRPENLGKWSLPGGRLKPREEPRTALRRELYEELGLRVARLVEVGDWWNDGENFRVFGADVRETTTAFDAGELIGVAWLELAQIDKLAAADRLRRGFELDAIARFDRLAPAADTARSAQHAAPRHRFGSPAAASQDDERRRVPKARGVRRR